VKLCCGNVPEKLLPVTAVERRMPCENLVEKNAQAVEIDWWPMSLSSKYLWGQVRDRAAE